MAKLLAGKVRTDSTTIRKQQLSDYTVEALIAKDEAAKQK